MSRASSARTSTIGFAWVARRRGFLDDLELHAGTFASPEIWLETARDPALATLRFLRKGKGSVKYYRRFVQAAPNLREVIAVSKDMITELVASPPLRLERLGVDAEIDVRTFDAIVAAFPHLKTLWIPLTAGNVTTQIARVAELAKRAPALEIVGRIGPDQGSLVFLAPWLLAARTELAALREVKVLFGGPFVTASAGERGLRVHLSVPHLHWVRDLVPALAPIEHATLTLTPGSPPPSDCRRLYDRLLAPLPSVTVDDPYRRALEL